MNEKIAKEIFGGRRNSKEDFVENFDEIFASMGKRCETLDYELITENGYFVAYETTTNAKIRLFPIE